MSGYTVFSRTSLDGMLWSLSLIFFCFSLCSDLSPSLFLSLLHLSLCPASPPPPPLSLTHTHFFLFPLSLSHIHEPTQQPFFYQSHTHTPKDRHSSIKHKHKCKYGHTYVHATGRSMCIYGHTYRPLDNHIHVDMHTRYWTISVYIRTHIHKYISLDDQCVYTDTHTGHWIIIQTCIHAIGRSVCIYGHTYTSTYHWTINVYIRTHI